MVVVFRFYFVYGMPNCEVDSLFIDKKITEEGIKQELLYNKFGSTRA